MMRVIIICFFLGFQIFIKYNFIHCSVIIMIDFCNEITDISCHVIKFRTWFCQIFNSFLLFLIQSRQILNRHIINIKIVSNNTIRINSLLKCVCDSQHVSSGIFGIKTYKKSVQRHRSFSRIPNSRKMICFIIKIIYNAFSISIMTFSILI